MPNRKRVRREFRVQEAIDWACCTRNSRRNGLWRVGLAAGDRADHAARSRSFQPELVAKGEALAGAGYCAECHTAKGGQMFAGGYAMATPFGVIYSTNITPDPETGIGTWSEAAFARAMHEGVARDGSHLFPAFPYDHFTKVSDDDVKAIYAFLMTRPPVRATTPANTIPFPFNIRALQEGWKILFFRPGRFRAGRRQERRMESRRLPRPWVEPLRRLPYAAQSAWRGKGKRRLCRCGGGQLDRAGVDRRKSCPVPWTQEELFGYLRNGVSVFHGAAAGPMSPVVQVFPRFPTRTSRPSLLISPISIRRASAPASADPAVARAMSYARLASGRAFGPRGAALRRRLRVLSLQFEAGPARGPARSRAQQRGESARPHQPDPSRAARRARGGRHPGVVMPGFARLSDTDIAHIAAYLRRTRTSLPPWPDLDTKVAAVRRLASALAVKTADRSC